MHLGAHAKHCPPRPRAAKGEGAGKCRSEGCERLVSVKRLLLCNMHYLRYRKSGELGSPESRKNSGEAAWSAYTVRGDGGCLLWVGPTDGSERGKIRLAGKSTRAYRYAWERVHGPLPPGMVIDHNPECPKSCVEVSHLRALTPSEHSKLGWSRGELDGGWGEASNYARRK